MPKTSKRPHDVRRGNALLFQPRGDADEFDHYLGPMGGDVRMSIKGPTVHNRDDHGGQSVQKIPRGSHGPRRVRSQRKDDEDY